MNQHGTFFLYSPQWDNGGQHERRQNHPGNWNTQVQTIRQDGYRN